MRKSNPKKNNLLGALLFLFLSAGFGSNLALAQNEPEPIPGIFLKDLRLIPVQSGGRIKPFDEFARETILSLTGSRSFGKFYQSEMMISMMVEPQAWAKVKLILIGNEEVRKELLFDRSQKYFSTSELMLSNTFLQYAQGVLSNGEGVAQVTNTGVNPVSKSKDPRSEELKRVVDRAARYQAIAQGKMWAISPPADQNPETAWATLSDGMTTPTAQSAAVYGILKAYVDHDLVAFQQKASIARDVISRSLSSAQSDPMKLAAEVFYNRLRPFLQAMIFYVLAGILWIFSGTLIGGFPLPRLMAKFMTAAGLIVHTTGFALRCYVAGRPPVTNMYESVIWVSLGVMVFATILYSKLEQTILMTVATFLSGLSLFAADSAPMIMDPTIRPLVPVLRSNYWLTIHVLTITLSYGAFMLAMGLANVSLFQFHQKNNVSTALEEVPFSKRITLLNQLAYRALMFGTVLLAVGTILGGVWADYSWGKFWGWDPKEVWALIALLSYMAVLHGRYAGWVGTFAFPLWTVICFSTVMMAWYGVNFVLGAGLHSYGFSSGGQTFMASFVTIQTLYCCFIAYENRKSKLNARTQSA